MEIFISYAWGAAVSGKRPLQEKTLGVVASVRKALPAARVWVDIEKLAAESCNRGMADAMVAAIDRANLVIVCISLEYQESKNCMAEYTYATGESKAIVYVKYGLALPRGVRVLCHAVL